MNLEKKTFSLLFCLIYCFCKTLSYNIILYPLQLKKEEDKRILKIINASMSAIKGQEELSISALKDVVSEALDEIIEEKNKAILEIGVHVKKGKESIANAVAKDRENIKESKYS